MVPGLVPDTADRVEARPLAPEVMANLAEDMVKELRDLAVMDRVKAATVLVRALVTVVAREAKADMALVLGPVMVAAPADRGDMVRVLGPVDTVRVKAVAMVVLVLVDMVREAVTVARGPAVRVGPAGSAGAQVMAVSDLEDPVVPEARAVPVPASARPPFASRSGARNRHIPSGKKRRKRR